MPLLCTPLALRDLTVANRMWVSPMCMYSCENRDGLVGPWHVTHYEMFARGGFGLVVSEATAVLAEGRISPQDAGLWHDDHVAAWRTVTDRVHAEGGRIAVQLAHAGRKAGTFRSFPGEDRGAVPLDHPWGWEPVGPTSEPFPGLNPPRAADANDLARIVQAFADAARRADQAGFDAVEIHAAHGYLLHQFLSPLSNTRDDAYGGPDGRVRLLVEVCAAVRASVPSGMPVLVRFSATDWVPGGWDVSDTVAAAQAVAPYVDFVDISSGGAVATAVNVPVGPGYQVPLAAEVRAGSGLPTGAVGQITTPAQAEQVLADGSADVVLLGRVALREPFWPLRAAAELGVPVADAGWRPQYVRGAWPA